MTGTVPATRVHAHESAVEILIGDCRDELRKLADESVQCVVTSPPYWGLRDYGIAPSVWGGDADCRHRWGAAPARKGGAGKQGEGGQRADRRNIKAQETKRQTGDFCRRCGAWRGVFGLEPTYELFVEHMVEIFREVWRVLRADGTLWLNLGDCYATNAGSVGRHPGGGIQGGKWKGFVGHRPDEEGPRGGHEGKHGYANGAVGIGPMTQPNRMPQPGLRAKNLVGIPWRVAIALQADGWVLRRDIIWHKPAPMPESVRDRCTTSHEYLFHFSKSNDTLFWAHRDRGLDRRTYEQPEPDFRWVHKKTKEERAEAPAGWSVEDRGDWTRINLWRGYDYYYDADAIMEPASPDSHARAARGRSDTHKWADGGPGGQTIARVPPPAGRKIAPHDTDGPRVKNNDSFDEALRTPDLVTMRNKRSVWTVGSEPFSEAHFATFPPSLIEPCILAGCPAGGVVLDPFGGAGTTGLVADRRQRRAVLIERNPDYAAMAERRIREDRPAMFAAAAPADRQATLIGLMEGAPA